MRVMGRSPVPSPPLDLTLPDVLLLLVIAFLLAFMYLLFRKGGE